MQLTKLNRAMLNDNTLGFWNTGMQLHVTAIPFSKARYIAMLYIERAMDEVTVENLTKLANSGWVMDSPWFPVAEGDSFTEALIKLEERLNVIRGDRANMDLWWYDVYQVQHEVSKHMNNREEYLIDSDILKINIRPAYMVPNGKETQQG